MSDPKLPRKSGAATKHAMRVLATAKLLKSLMAPAEKQAKTYLEAKELSPKDRRTITLDDGTDVGTVSMVEGRTKAPIIVDAEALAKWCDKHGVEHAARWEPVFPEWFTAKANLEALIDGAGGEIPDGLAIPDQGKPYVMVRQTTGQAMALADAFTSASDLINAVTPLQIEGDTQ